MPGIQLAWCASTGQVDFKVQTAFGGGQTRLSGYIVHTRCVQLVTVTCSFGGLSSGLWPMVCAAPVGP